MTLTPMKAERATAGKAARKTKRTRRAGRLRSSAAPQNRRAMTLANSASPWFSAALMTAR